MKKAKTAKEPHKRFIVKEWDDSADGMHYLVDDIAYKAIWKAPSELPFERKYR